MGERFSNWREYFHFEIWNEILKRNRFKIVDKVINGFDLNEELPWEFIDIGINKSFLIYEREKSKRGEITEPCFIDFEKCSSCGVCFNL